MQNLIHTNLYGEKNFNVISCITRAACTEIIAFCKTNTSYKGISIELHKSYSDYEHVLMIPSGEVVTSSEFESLTINDIKRRLSNFIDILSEKFSKEDEIYFYLSGNNMKGMGIMSVIREDNLKRLYQQMKKPGSDFKLTRMTPIYFDEVIPMKISDFENALAELQNSINAELDQFQFMQNLYIMKKFFEMMSSVVKQGNFENYRVKRTLKDAMRWFEPKDIYKTFYVDDLKEAIKHVLNEENHIFAEFLDDDAKLTEYSQVIECIRDSSYTPSLFQLFALYHRYKELFTKLSIF